MSPQAVAVALVEKASAAGLTLRVENGKLRGREPGPELRAELAEHRQALVAYFSLASACGQCGTDEAYVEFGDHTPWRSQTLCYACAKEALCEIASAVPPPDARAFVAAVRRYWPGAEVMVSPPPILKQEKR
jgi:hypothetical protein